MNKELLSALLWSLKDILVYFERTNRHLYRYNGFEICKKIFLKSIKDDDLEYVFVFFCKTGLCNLCKILLKDPRLDTEKVGNIELYGRPFENSRFVDVILTDFGLFVACMFNHANVVSILLGDNRFDASFDNDICIYKAAVYNRYEIVKMLSKDPRVNIQRALGAAQERGHAEIVHLLTEKKLKKSF